MIELLCQLLFAHVVADFALQPTVMAQGKKRSFVPSNIPKVQKLTPCWFYWLQAHSLTNAAAVYMFTGSLTLAVIESFVHAGIDFIKCEGYTNPHQDQGLHYLSKIAYLFI